MVLPRNAVEDEEEEDSGSPTDDRRRLDSNLDQPVHQREPDSRIRVDSRGADTSNIDSELQ